MALIQIHIPNPKGGYADKTEQLESERQIQGCVAALLHPVQIKSYAANNYGTQLRGKPSIMPTEGADPELASL